MIYYTREGVPYTDDTLRWARDVEASYPSKRVAETFVGRWRVSTIFLDGLNHAFSDDVPPLLFETMTFDVSDMWAKFEGDLLPVPEDLPELVRYTTEMQSIIGHAGIVGWLRTRYELPAAPPRCAFAHLEHTCDLEETHSGRHRCPTAHPHAEGWAGTAGHMWGYAQHTPRGAAPAAAADTCERCRRPFDYNDTRFDGRARQGTMPFCRSCVDRCHESNDAGHRCPICKGEEER